MSDMLRCIYANIRNLRFSIEFDVYDLSKEHQESMLNRLDEIESILRKVEAEGGKEQ